MKVALNTIKLMEGGGGQTQCRRELEQRMRNIYVPLNVLLNQNVVDLQEEEPIYEEIPPSGLLHSLLHMLIRIMTYDITSCYLLHLLL